MNRMIILCVILLVQYSLTEAVSFKKYAGEYMHIGIGGRALAMGGAAVATVNDVTSAYWNPAGLTQAKGFQIEFMHTKQFISSIQQNYLGLSNEYDENSTIAFSLIYLTVKDIQDSRNAAYITDQGTTRLDYSKISGFSTGDYTFLASYGRIINDKIAVGISAKGIYRDYKVEHALGIGFDVGAKYMLIENLTLGAILRDITTTMISWSTGEKELIKPSLRLGASYNWNISAIDLSVQPAFDINVLFENRQYAAQKHIGPISFDSFYGLEVGYKSIIAVRAGMDDLNRFNTGIGLQIPVVRFDYTFTSFASELGDIHRISFHLDFKKIF
ncbi:MAG: PorV/PorQ family protein [Calditrichaceae bacterium]|nr:PorV/PorQ family protein [Calditrichaceae bacterium]MBN2709927.1 PorV/PorQ family protein [Calditrichaceae bacterium]